MGGEAVWCVDRGSTDLGLDSDPATYFLCDLE